jgi:hypothetical protein
MYRSANKCRVKLPFAIQKSFAGKTKNTTRQPIEELIMPAIVHNTYYVRIRAGIRKWYVAKVELS